MQERTRGEIEAESRVRKLEEENARLRAALQYTWTAWKVGQRDYFGKLESIRATPTGRREGVGRMSYGLTERRARFVYESARLAAVATNAPIVPVPWEQREQNFHDQFLAVIERQCGEQRSTSPEELHGSWMQAYFAMGWIYGKEYDREKRIHPDLVPYAQLGQLERDKDAVFVALCEIARQWIHELNEGGGEEGDQVD